MMEMEMRILRILLEKYEASANYREAESSGRRVLIHLGPKSRDLKEYSPEHPEEKEEVHTAVLTLAGERLVSYAWERFEKGNILDIVWLELDQVDAAYARAGLVPKRQIVMGMIQQMESCLESLLEMEDTSSRKPRNVSFGMGGTNRGWILGALREAVGKTCSCGRMGAPFPVQPGRLADLLVAFRLLSFDSFTDARIRVFSIHGWRDSKYFERNVKADLLAVLRQSFPLAEEEAGEGLREDDWLERVGLFRNPEIYEFCGPVRMLISSAKGVLTASSSDGVPASPFTDDGAVWMDFSVFRAGACLHAAAVSDILAVSAGKVTRLLFIENRTNYDAYINTERRQDEMVVYHGGFHGPRKQYFFRLLSQAVSPECEVRHWGDIDVGGMRIFLQIQTGISSKVRPWRMDSETLRLMRKFAVPFDSKYRSIVESALKNEIFGMFHDALAFMLEAGTRLEQEAFLYDGNAANGKTAPEIMTLGG